MDLSGLPKLCTNDSVTVSRLSLEPLALAQKRISCVDVLRTSGRT